MRTFIEINQQALLNNIQWITKLCPQSRLAPVIKANAYGHGQLEIARILNTIPIIDFMCVAHAQEALSLKESGITKQLLTLAYIYEYLEDLIKQDIAITVYDHEQLKAIIAAAHCADKKARIHLKLDTGMCRLGFNEQQIFELLNNAFKSLSIEGICTHLNDKDSPDLNYTHTQLKLLQKINSRLDQKLYTHGLSSGALDLAQDYPFTHVRPGTNIYGLWSSAQSKERAQSKLPDISLEPVAQWKCSILQLKYIPRGSFIGYNRTFQASHDMIIAVIPIGYADGYPRQLSNKGYMRIRNHILPVVGIVSMNLITLDVTDVPHISYQDVVTIYDHLPETSVECAALHTNTINIELMTRLHPEIPRLII